MTSATVSGRDERASLLDGLLAALTRHRDAHNRRPLYAAFDELLGKAGAEDVAQMDEALRRYAAMRGINASADRGVRRGGPSDKMIGAATVPSDAIRLRTITLRNWKLFERATLTVPSPTDDGSDILLIGGRNGHGKSSLLEAYTFALFGSRAIAELGLLAEGGGRRSGRRAYAAAMEASLSRTASAAGEAMMSVTLVFDTASGPFVVDRHWYFDDDGAFLEAEEEVILRSGVDGDILTPTGTASPLAWGQDEIERRVMPTSLAPFYLLDGEKIDRWSQGQLGDLVQTGLDRTLGFDRYAALVGALKGYAAERGRDVAADVRAPDDFPRQEVNALATALAAVRDERQAAAIELRPLIEARDAALDALSREGGATHAELGALLERERRTCDEHDALERDLLGQTMQSLPLALCGAAIIGGLKASLRRRTARETERIGAPEQLQLLLSRMETRIESEGTLRREVLSLVEDAWNGRADDLEANGEDADTMIDARTGRRLLDRLEGAGVARAELRTALARLRENEAFCAGVRGEIDAVETAETRRHELGLRLDDLRAKIEAAENWHADAERRAASLNEALAPKRAALVSYEEEVERAIPRVRQLNLASRIGTRVADWIATERPRHYETFGEIVSRWFERLSHKEQVGRVSIAPSGEVRLLSRHGADLTAIRLSAGEAQVLVVALVAAVNDVIGRPMPLILDTPFGRLDTDHRRTVIDFLVHRSGQTVLLAQPEEMGASELERLGGHLAGRLEVSFRMDPGAEVGTSRVGASMEAAE